MATLTQTAAYHPSQCSSSTTSLGHLNLQSQPPQPAPSSSNEQAAFAFVRIHDDVCLVQTDDSLAVSKSSPLPTAVDLAIFRHEFGTMFRLARRARLPASDVQLIAPLDHAGLLLDTESNVVFLAREVTNQLLQYTALKRRAQVSPQRSRRRY